MNKSSEQYKILESFSKGDAHWHEVTQKLGLNDYEELLEKLSLAGLSEYVPTMELVDFTALEKLTDEIVHSVTNNA